MKNMNLNQTMHFKVDSKNAGIRLDLYINLQVKGISRSRAAALIKTTNVQLNSQSAKPSTIVHENDEVQLIIPALKATYLTAQKIPLDIIYQNKDIVVVNKPPDLTVHPAPGHPDGTLVNALLHLIPDLRGIGGEQRPGIVHRLDKDTSGLIVVAKNDYAHKYLSDQLKNRLVSKTYVALLHGNLTNDY